MSKKQRIIFYFINLINWILFLIVIFPPLGMFFAIMPILPLMLYKISRITSVIIIVLNIIGASIKKISYFDAIIIIILNLIYILFIFKSLTGFWAGV